MLVEEREMCSIRCASPSKVSENCPAPPMVKAHDDCVTTLSLTSKHFSPFGKVIDLYFRKEAKGIGVSSRSLGRNPDLEDALVL